MKRNTIIIGDCLETMQCLPHGLVSMCVTSPPYYGLRDYGADGQIGMEKTPGQYIDRLVAVFSEVRRVLADNGTLWLNLGDSYANDGASGGETGGKQAYLDDSNRKRVGREKRVTGLKPKDLCGIPWRVALALQADGWWLRQDIIWHKPNAMPESVTDRCTKGHEYLFLLTKSQRYYFDHKAIREPGLYAGPPSKNDEPASHKGSQFHTGKTAEHQLSRASEKPRTAGKWSQTDDQSSGRRLADNVKRARAEGNDHDRPFGEMANKRSVWSVMTKPYKEAHFATFPPELIKPCILAGCPAGGLVFDPFGGSGTTGQVARALGRDYLLCELNPDYAMLAEKRIRTPLYDDSPKSLKPCAGQRDLFAGESA